jgi:hypothetical protein
MSRVEDAAHSFYTLLFCRWHSFLDLLGVLKDSMKKLTLILLFAPLTALFAQATLTIKEVDMGLIAGYHTLLTDPNNFVLGEEYELGAYMHETSNGALVAVTTSYVRNGAFGTNYNLPFYAIGKFSTAKLKFGKLWEGNTFDFLLASGFGYFAGADYSNTSGLIDLVHLDPENPVSTFTIPIEMNIQWYGFDGSINAIAIKYELNGWSNYLGVGFTYLL